MSRTVHLTYNDHGFKWGALDVVWVTSLDDGSVVLELATEAGHSLEVYCSPGGRSLRVFRRRLRNGKVQSSRELK